MGKGTILENKGNGQYRLRVLLNTQRIEQRVSKIDAELEKLPEDLQKMADERVPLFDAVVAAEAALAAAAADYNAAAENKKFEKEQALIVAQLAAAKAEFAVRSADHKIALTKLRGSTLRKEKEWLQNHTPTNPEVDAWCADATDNLTGEVATLELPVAEKNSKSEIAPIQIRPGYQGGATYSSSRDGQLQPLAASGPSASYWNRGALPAWQKWRPTYRLGKITTLTGNTCTVELDPAISSQQNLNVNQSPTLANVPISYMDCNGGAFAVDDRVVVEFESRLWAKPKVIGFERNPRPCEVCYLMMVGRSSGTIEFYKFKPDGSVPVLQVTYNLTIPSNGGALSPAFDGSFWWEVHDNTTQIATLYKAGMAQLTFTGTSGVQGLAVNKVSLLIIDAVNGQGGARPILKMYAKATLAQTAEYDLTPDVPFLGGRYGMAANNDRLIWGSTPTNQMDIVKTLENATIATFSAANFTYSENLYATRDRLYWVEGVEGQNTALIHVIRPDGVEDQVITYTPSGSGTILQSFAVTETRLWVFGWSAVFQNRKLSIFRRTVTRDENGQITADVYDMSAPLHVVNIPNNPEFEPRGAMGYPV